MNFDQILIRLGVDASAVNAGLSRVSGLVKGWGTSLAADLKGRLGAMFAAGVVVAGLDRLKNKVLEIARISRETGASTNFIQSLQQQAGKTGESFEGMASSLTKFSKLIGHAKTGDVGAIKTLSDMHVLTDKNSVKTLTLSTALHNLSDRFHQLNDEEKQNYLLSQAAGKQFESMRAIVENGSAGLDRMNQGSFFTKLGKGSISDVANAWAGIKTAMIITGATLVNTLDIPFRLAANLSARLGAMRIFGGSGNINQTIALMNSSEEKSSTREALRQQAEQDGLTVQEEKTKLFDEQNSLLEKQAELMGEINDRDKLTVKEMAAESRKILGLKSPLSQSHTVTARMRTALKIDTLEERATLAWERGNDKLSHQLQTEADQVRKANPWLRRTDQNPMLKTENELKRINTQIEPISRAAKLVEANS